MSKANTLKLLENFNGDGYIIDFFITFSVKDWRNDYDKILDHLVSGPFKEFVVVRSSAIYEDNHIEIPPGQFCSILNVDVNSKFLIKKAVNTVIKSYQDNIIAQKYFLENEIIVQQQLLGPLLSGVLDASNFYYYTIEFTDDSTKTNNVTSGKPCKSINIFRNYSPSLSPWKEIIIATKKVEKLIKWSSYQIEFALDHKNRMHIFQAKKTSPIHNKPIRRSIIKKELLKCSTRLKSLHKISPIWSDMTDWNPAEMLGELPKPLEISLYEYLITNNTWIKARVLLGYNITAENLLFSIGGKPYINVSRSFNSLYPASIKRSFAKELLEIQLKYLMEKPYLHDKVEFEILFSCSNFGDSKQMLKLLKYGLTEEKVKIFNKLLDEFTVHILKGFNKNYHKDYKSIRKLHQWQQIHLVNRNDVNELHSNAKLLKQALSKCRELGVLPFAKEARYAFIAKYLFERIISTLKIPDNEIDSFWKSFPTISNEVATSLSKVKSKRMRAKTFYNKYGHLRPNTYNLESPRYDQINFNLLTFQEPVATVDIEKDLKPTTEMVDSISVLISNILNLDDFDGNQFLDFVVKATQMRELLKFHFSAVVSDSLEIIAAIGDEIGFSRNEMRMLKINEILEGDEYKDYEDVKEKWAKLITKRMEKYEIQKCIKYPSILLHYSDFFIHYKNDSIPNYITDKCINEELVLIDNAVQFNKLDLTGKIVCIEAADPGYDWIFSFNFSGLITKYGGAASHMAMRCAQNGIPAAIGCGEMIFDKVRKSQRVEINCKQKTIQFY